MSRFKFRVWDTVNKEMIQPSPYFAIGLEGTVCSGSIDGDMISDYEGQFIPMQSIGRKDINKKEIFEGDIVMLYGWNIKQIVEWADDCACFHVFSKKQRCDLCDAMKDNIVEVIGNIYENPELLD